MLRLITLTTFFLTLISCATTGSMVETKPAKEGGKLKEAKDACVQASAKDEKFKNDAEKLSGELLKQLTEKKVFPSVKLCGPKPVKGQLAIQVVLLTVDPGSTLGTFFGGGHAEVTYSGKFLIDEKNFGEFQGSGNSSRSIEVAGGQFFNKTGKAVASSADEIVKLLMKKRQMKK